jgi:hypothetical protein
MAELSCLRPDWNGARTLLIREYARIGRHSVVSKVNVCLLLFVPVDSGYFCTLARSCGGVCPSEFRTTLAFQL